MLKTCTGYHYGKWSQWFTYVNDPCPVHGPIK